MLFAMEFLTLLIGYLLVFSFFTVVCICGDHPSCINGPIGWVKRSLTKAFFCLIPKQIVDLGTRFVYYVYQQRNPTMQIVFGILVLSGHAIVVIDIFPILYGIFHDDNHVLVPMLLLFLNLFVFYKLCGADPGEITKDNHAVYSFVYPYDGAIYQKKTICKTCNFSKPARSKHCSVCNRCVHRFDHHCVWTNNCIGALNNHYFLAFLITLIMMCVNGFYMALRSIVSIAQYSGMVDALIMQANGKMTPVTLSALVQHLFMQFPRIIFLMASLSVLSLLMAGFTVYHLYLMFTNQTSNERYKIGSIKNSERCCKKENTEAIQSKKPNKRKTLNTRPYNQGFLKNIAQVLFPKNYIEKHKKVSHR